MAGKQISRSKYRIILIALSILGFSLLIFLSSLSPLRNSSLSSSAHFHLPTSQTSFVGSLEQFLAKTQSSPSLPDDTVPESITDQHVKNLDDAIFHSETYRLYSDPFYPISLPLRVYVYNMPSKFTYDLLLLFQNTYRDTSNLTSNGSPVHRLIEQHSIDYWLWADLIAPQSERLLKSVVRVHRQEDADLFYIPFFTTISFFLLEKQQCKALYRVKL
ncbi:hypothetical protein KIW84_073827 [Lathyrus oleraceus]|uniref:Exostosin GT47 domain-containing protein n=1 Tax=Pisum sativum TaxID=3888 RepID=A0A9D4VQ83_PEA|nr:hypothetical protein KIW84_073827 [Pisum sativum]